MDDQQAALALLAGAPEKARQVGGRLLARAAVQVELPLHRELTGPQPLDHAPVDARRHGRHRLAHLIDLQRAPRAVDQVGQLRLGQRILRGARGQPLRRGTGGGRRRRLRSAQRARAWHPPGASRRASPPRRPVSRPPPAGGERTGRRAAGAGWRPARAAAAAAAGRETACCRIPVSASCPWRAGGTDSSGVPPCSPLIPCGTPARRSDDLSGPPLARPADFRRHHHAAASLSQRNMAACKFASPGLHLRPWVLPRGGGCAIRPPRRPQSAHHPTGIARASESSPRGGSRPRRTCARRSGFTQWGTCRASPASSRGR